jgi:hypothetical protein
LTFPPRKNTGLKTALQNPAASGAHFAVAVRLSYGDSFSSFHAQSAADA